MSRRKRRGRKCRNPRNENDPPNVPSSPAPTNCSKRGYQQRSRQQQPRLGDHTVSDSRLPPGHHRASPQPSTTRLAQQQVSNCSHSRKQKVSIERKRQEGESWTIKREQLASYLRQVIEGGQRQLQLWVADEFGDSDEDEMMDWQPECEVRIVYIADKSLGKDDRNAWGIERDASPALPGLDAVWGPNNWKMMTGYQKPPGLDVGDGTRREPGLRTPPSSPVDWSKWIG
ncbi:MAG: hypothetical protein M1818_003541 [Claussenomyces sp. TS43310]|nr:MAG: hypothetical protein M1818_003541 [Claussenomyces sp. TS43310]